MDWAKLLKALVRVAEAQGWRVERRTKHHLFFPSDKSRPPVVLPGTPSSQRTPVNTLAELRRAGLIWPPPDGEPRGDG